ncbi:MAG: PilN domain-containing protein [Phycisphaerales bacterium]
MSTRDINLLPSVIRERVDEARLRAFRVVVIAVAVVVLGAAASHGWVVESAASAAADQTRAEATRVLRREAEINELKATIDLAHEARRRYELIASPVEVGDLLATVVNAMPPGLSVDQLDFDAAPRRGRSARLVTDAGLALPTRKLRGVIVGFARDDSGINDFVVRLSETPPFSRVRIDVSRSRSFRKTPVREFNISFEVDFGARYDVARAATETSP